MLIDRSVSLYFKDALKNKIGAAVVTNDVGSYGGKLVAQALADYFIPDNFFAGSVIGEGGTNKNNVKKDKKAFRRAKELGKRIMELDKLVETKKPEI